MATEAFTDDNFEAEVLRSSAPVLVDFTASWCPPCQSMVPVIERLAADYAGRLRVGSADVEHNSDIATRYRIHHLPTLLVFRGGVVVAQVTGAVPRVTLDALLQKLV